MAAMRGVPRVAVADARLHGGDEALEADGGELAQQARQVAEMVLGRRVRDAGFARRRAQGEALMPSRSRMRSAACSSASRSEPWW